MYIFTQQKQLLKLNFYVCFLKYTANAQNFTNRTFSTHGDETYNICMENIFQRLNKIQKIQYVKSYCLQLCQRLHDYCKRQQNSFHPNFCCDLISMACTILCPPRLHSLSHWDLAVSVTGTSHSQSLGLDSLSHCYFTVSVTVT